MRLCIGFMHDGCVVLCWIGLVGLGFRFYIYGEEGLRVGITESWGSERDMTSLVWFLELENWNDK